MPLGPRRTSRAVVRRGRRRQLVWTTFDNTVTLPVAAPNVSNVDLLNQMELAGTSKTGITIMRTIVQLALPSAGAANAEYEVGTLVGRLTDVGTTRINPNGDNDLDWSWFQRYFRSFSGATADTERLVTIDHRAKRKCGEMGQTYILSIWTNNNTAPVVRVFGRVLVAMP